MAKFLCCLVLGFLVSLECRADEYILIDEPNQVIEKFDTDTNKTSYRVPITITLEPRKKAEKKQEKKDVLVQNEEKKESARD